MVIDGHVMLGSSRDASLTTEELLGSMDRHGIDQAVVSPSEYFLPVRNREGNERIAETCNRSDGRLLQYAVATPWLGREALDELERAREGGARALKLDPALQGFDPLDGQVAPLIEFALEAGWPVYIRTGTPPHGLPLQVAWLTSQFPDCQFVLGRSGATDFSHDGPTALAASNVFADSAYVEWPTALASAQPEQFGQRVVFTSDAPFGDVAIELARVREASAPAWVTDAVLGGNLARLLG